MYRGWGNKDGLGFVTQDGSIGLEGSGGPVGDELDGKISHHINLLGG